MLDEHAFGVTDHSVGVDHYYSRSLVVRVLGMNAGAVA
jgi:hypothetical protein